MKFLKYNDKWAYGKGRTEIKLITTGNTVDKDWLEEILDEINNQHNWSDKYRGIDYEIVDYPGHEWMKENIRKCKERIKNTEILLGEYNALYYKNGGS